MNFDVSVNGKPWKVAIDQAGDQAGRYTVTVKGKRRDMDAAWIDDQTLSLIDMQTGMAREIRLTPHAGALEVGIGGHVFLTTAEKRGQTPASMRGEPTQHARHPFAVADGRVVAPMPGRVVRVLVAVGDNVTARQGVIVVEAMKMENELRAPKDGTVTQVLVQVGTAIERGAVLVVVE